MAGGCACAGSGRLVIHTGVQSTPPTAEATPSLAAIEPALGETPRPIAYGLTGRTSSRYCMYTKDGPLCLHVDGCLYVRALCRGGWRASRGRCSPTSEEDRAGRGRQPLPWIGLCMRPRSCRPPRARSTHLVDHDVCLKKGPTVQPGPCAPSTTRRSITPCLLQKSQSQTSMFTTADERGGLYKRKQTRKRNDRDSDHQKDCRCGIHSARVRVSLVSYGKGKGRRVRRGGARGGRKK